MRRLFLILTIATVTAGCTGPSQRLNAPPQGFAGEPHQLQQPYHAMSANAVLQDMSVADIHFAGATARLSGTGIYRLNQMCKLLHEYGGGEVRYTTTLTDDDLVQARLESIEAYLAQSCDMSKVTVRLGQPASNTMRADVAIQAQQAPNACSSDGGMTSISNAAGFGERK